MAITSQIPVNSQAIPHFARKAGLPQLTIFLLNIWQNYRNVKPILPLNWLAIQGRQDFSPALSQQAFR